MIPFKEVQDAVVTGLRSITTLTSQLGGPAYITGFDPEDGEVRSALEAMRGMQEGSLLVVFDGVSEVLRGEVPRWAYNFSIAMFCPGDITSTMHPGYFNLAQSIIDGVIPTPGLRWLDAPVHDSFDPPADVRFERASVDGTETWHMTFSLIEIGG